MSGSTPGSDLPPPTPPPPSPGPEPPTTPPRITLEPPLPPTSQTTTEPTTAEPAPPALASTMSDSGYPTVAPPPPQPITTETPPPETTTTSDPPPPVTTTTNPLPITTTDPPPPVTTTSITNPPPPQTTSTTELPVTTTTLNRPPDTTTTLDRTTNRPPPVTTTTTTEDIPPETTVTTPPYTTLYITTVSVVTITTIVPHTTMISGSVTIIYATETTTSLQPTIIQDPRQPPPPSSTYTSRNGFHPWQIGLAVALILVLMALCFAAVVMIWFRRRRQELRDQEDKVVGSREPWNDPATAAAVMGPSSGGGGGGGAASAAGVMHPGWHEYNKEASLMAATAGDSRAMSSMDGGYHHVQHHHFDTRYGPNGELMLIGYADPYGGGGDEDMTDYMGDHSRAFNGSDGYELGLDYAMGSEIGGGAELASNSGSLAGDHLSYSGSTRYPIPPPLQRQYVSSNHPQESQPVSPVPRMSYEDDYHAAVALRQQLQQQQQQQQSRVSYPQPPLTATSASRQPSRDEIGTTTTGTIEATEEDPADDYRLNLEKYSKVEHRRQSPHALIVLGHPAGDQDGEIGGEAASPSGIVTSPLEGSMPNAITGEEKEGAYRRDELTPEPGSSSGQRGDGDGGGIHERGPSTPGEETAAVRSYLDRLRVDS